MILTSCFFGVDYYCNGKVEWGEYFDSNVQTSLNYSSLHSPAAEGKKVTLGSLGWQNTYIFFQICDSC